MDEKTLKSIVRLQKRFAKLYDVTGLIGISSDYVQIKHEYLAELLKQYPDAPNEIYKNHGDYEITIKVFGIAVLGLGTQEEWAELGIEVG